MDAIMQRSQNLPRRAFLPLAVAALPLPFIHGVGASGLRIRVGGSGAGLSGIMLLGSLQAPDEAALQAVPGLGTLGGLRAVRAGHLEVAVSTRPPSAAESQDGLRSVQYARTPVVFATHPGTAVESLSLEEAVRMVGGTSMNWPDGLPVRLSRRPDLDADTAILMSLSPAMSVAVASLQRRPGVMTAGTDHDQAEALEVQRGTLGVLSLCLILSERRGLKALPLRDAPPTPMLKPLFAVTRTNPPPQVEALMRRIWSEEAHRILSAHGHIPQPAA